MARQVTLLSQFFHPETASVPQLLTELALGLQQRGFSLKVLTAQPSYHRAEKCPRRETLDGVRVRRLFSTQLQRLVLGGRLLNAITFCLSVASHLVASKDPGVLIATTTPPFLPWVAWLIGRIRRLKYVVLVHDLYPDVAVALGYVRQGGVAARLWTRLNRTAFSQADAVIVLGESMRKEVGKYLSRGSEAVHVIHSWADGEYIVPREKEGNWFAQVNRLHSHIIVLYSGNIGMAHDFETLVDAAEQLKSVSNLLFVFIGEGGKRDILQTMVKERALRNVRFLPHMPYKDLPFSLASGDIGVVTLESGVEGLCEPSKLYGYLAAGLAILALVGEQSEVARIVDEHRCGIRIVQKDVEGVVNALQYWVDNPAELERMKNTARACFEANFSRDKTLDKYADVLRGL